MASLSEVPFLSGYMQQGQLNRQNELDELRQAAGAQSLMANARAQKQAEQDQAEMERVKQLVSQAGGDPTKAIQALNSTGNLKAMRIAAELQRSLPKAEKPDKPQLVTVQTPQGPMQRWIKPNETEGVDVGAPAEKPAADKMSNLRRLFDEMNALPPGDPMRETYKDAIRKESQTAKQISPTVVMPRQEPLEAVVGADGRTTLVPRSEAKGMTPARFSPEAQGGVEGAKVSARDMAKREASYPESTKQVNMVTENVTALKSQLTALKNHKGLSGITGAVFGRTPSVTDDSMAAQAIYDNVVNNVFVNALQSMRAASKTGGAVGNVSDKEGERLEQTLAALSRAQGTKDFKNQVNIALDRLDIAEKNVKEAYEQTYSYRSQNPQRRSTDQQPAMPPPPPGFRPD